MAKTPAKTKRRPWTAARKKRWAYRRRVKARTAGSAWIYFKDGENGICDLWDGCTIIITRSVKEDGLWRQWARMENPAAEFPFRVTERDSRTSWQKAHAIMHEEREVQYSELW